MLINVIDAGAGGAVGFDLGLSIKSGLISILGVSPSYIPLLTGGREWKSLIDTYVLL